MPDSTRMCELSFDVLKRKCGTGENTAAVEWDDKRVIIDGVIDGRNTCYTAEMQRAHYDSETDELAVTVYSYEDNEGDGCGMCILNIDYQVTFDFTCGTPDE